MTYGKKRPKSDLAKSRRDKVGIFGGAFNPPHAGHLIIAEWVCAEFGLKQVIFVPTFLPPHKETSIPFNLRLRMVKITIQKNSCFAVSGLEKNIAGPSYTVKTLRRLRSKLPRADFFLIIGSDQFLEFQTWQQPKAIFDAANLIIVRRPGHPLPDHITFHENIYVSSAPILEISSSQIRRRVKEGLSIRYLVAKPVEAIIKRHRLYK